MPQQPFTPVGVQAKFTELYALSNTDLLAQANLVRTDFRAWVANNFTLNGDQLMYLDNLNDDWVQLSACQTSFAMKQRLPVNLVAPEPSGASKLIGSSNDMTVYDNSGVIEAEGSLTFTIRYE